MLKNLELQRSPHAIYQLSYHFVFILKWRKKVLFGDVAKRLRQICEDVATERDWRILELSIHLDHVHLFVGAHPKDAPNEVVRAFKGRSSRILRQEFPHLLRLPSLWTHSYFVRSSGHVSAAVIERYIREQSS